MIRRLLVLMPLYGALAAGLAVEQSTPDELLQSIRRRVADNLARLPNYTCRQTIERSMRTGSHQFERIDTIRLEVALIRGTEWYAWPGSPKFEDKRIQELVTSLGAIGSGVFALHLRELFTKRFAEFTYAGISQAAGRSAVRFDFRVPRERGFLFIADGESAMVGYRGSLWADSTNYDLIRLDVDVEEFPPPLTLRVTRSHDSIYYAQVPIGSDVFLLPQSAEMSVVVPAGEYLNRVRLDACKHYVGDSVLTFGDTPEERPAREAVREISLPPGLTVEVHLQTPIALATTAIGDPVTAVLARDVRRKRGATLLPKGAMLSGHVTRLERRRGRPWHWVVGVTLESVEADGVRAVFAGTLRRAGIEEAYYVPFSGSVVRRSSPWWQARIETAPPRRNEGVWCVTRETRIPAGLPLIWETTADEP